MSKARWIRTRALIPHVGDVYLMRKSSHMREERQCRKDKQCARTSERETRNPDDLPLESSKMEHKETGCQSPEGPILCINNCGFFGSAATMNMCSKCHKDMLSKQEQAKLAASSIEKFVNCSSNEKDPFIPENADVAIPSMETKVIPAQPSDASVSSKCVEMKVKEGPSRCSTCRKRVGLTGFNCRCGNLYCATHRYSDKHNCPFDYRTAGRDVIAKANPVVKADKFDRI
ncbi:hypothetical protein Taro_053767 [Colocasia esculenta]|uniref:Zinc finger A20 and AN1 domain-containing stress-associated protein 8 n=1 Tax=Colocasia esculenta TaxID=4460 RepID=A0A843XM34_COLES|nr:hypothetical protein [Colocasia esculenta]